MLSFRVCQRRDSVHAFVRSFRTTRRVRTSAPITMNQRVHLVACGAGIMASLVVYSILQVTQTNATFGSVPDNQI